MIHMCHVIVFIIGIVYTFVLIVTVSAYDYECECKYPRGDYFSGKHYKSIPPYNWPNKKCVIFNNNDLVKLKMKSWGNLPKELKCLFLRNNTMQIIKGQDIFRNLTHLILLNIANNNFTEESFNIILKSIEKSHIKILDISGNAVASKRFVRIHGRLTELHMNNCQLTNLNFLKTDRRNYLLRKLELRNNKLKGESLQIINAYANLTTLNLSGNLIIHLSAQTFSQLVNLQELSLANLPSRNMTFPGIHSASLKGLDISNSFSLLPVNQSKHVFNMSVNVEKLNLVGIKLAPAWSDEDLLQLFSPMKKLGVLVLSNTSLGRVPKNVFNGMNVLEVLDLSKNGISNWEKECFENMSIRFKELYLNDNNISSITNKTFPYELLQRLRKLHLFGNNFQCDCSLHWFRYWMKSHYGILDALSADKSQFIYKCYNPTENNSTLLIDFDPSYEDCHGLSISEILALSIVSFCFVTIGTLNVLMTIRESSGILTKQGK